MWWENLLKELGSTAILFAVIGWVFKSLFNNYLDKNVSEFRAKLENERFSNQERSKNLIEKQVLKIELLYQKIDKTIASARNVTKLFEESGISSKVDRYNEFANNANEYIEFYNQNKIWFKPDLVQKINIFNDEIRDIMITFEFSVVRNEGKNQYSNSSIEKWNDCWKKLTKTTIPKMLDEIETDFRLLLSV